jgi:lipopolysaccharide export LptBFGC system permease protein LptF
MNRLSIYIVRAFLPWLAIAVGAAMLIFLATQLIRIAPVFFGAGASFGETVSAIGLLLVPVATWALTPAFAVAAFALAGQMAEDGELTALDAAGVGRFGVITGPFVLALALTFLSAWLWIFACPDSQAMLRGYAAELAGKALNERLEAGFFTEPLPGITFYSDQKKGGRFQGVALEQACDAKRSTQLVASEGETFFCPSSRRLVVHLEKGTGFLGSDSKDAPRVALSFEELYLRLPLDAILEDKLNFLPAVMAQPTFRLMGSTPPGVNPAESSFALWRRIAGPIGFWIMSCLSLYLAFGATWRHRNAAIASAVCIFGFFHLAGRFGESLMDKGLITPRCAALAPLAIAGFWLIALPIARFWRIRLAKIGS